MNFRLQNRKSNSASQRVSRSLSTSRSSLLTTRTRRVQRKHQTQNMAPESQILKRQRSRPGNWWEASTHSPQNAEPSRREHSNTKRPRHSQLGDAAAADKENSTKSELDALVAVAPNEGHKTSSASRGRPPKTKPPLQSATANANVEKVEKTQGTLLATTDRTQHEAPPAGRGRLSKAKPISKPVEEETEEAVEARLSKRKRKRPSEFWVVQSTEVETPAIANGRKIETGQPPALHEAEGSSRRRKRQSTVTQVDSHVSSAKDPPGRKKQSELPYNDQHVMTRSEAASTTDQIRSNKRRGNTSSNDQPTVNKSTKTLARKMLKNSSDAEVEVEAVETATSSFGRARTGKTSRDKPAKVTKVSTEQHSKKTKRARVSDGNTGTRSKTNNSNASGKKTANTLKTAIQNEAPSREPHVARRHKANVNPDVEQEESMEDVPGYQRLTTVTRRIPHQTIAKWEPLPNGSIEGISHLLRGVERPVVMRLHERKRLQASTAMQMVTRRIVKRLSKGLPFPAGSRSQREDDFDFEKILNNNRALDTQLTPILHANELLEAELIKEKAMLGSEREDLANLETNAKSESLKRKQAGRKVHALVQPEADMKEDAVEEFGLITGLRTLPQPLNTCKDDGLVALMKDVSGHVDSMNGNMSQIQGISQALSKGKAAVQATLFDQLQIKDYDSVVLG